MALHPHKSRKKRLENAVTLGLFWLCLVGMLAVLPMGRDDWTWNDVLRQVGPLLLLGLTGVAGLVAYVKKGDR